MKKIIILSLMFVLTLALSACASKGEESPLTLDQIIEAYTSAGVEVDPNEKQIVEMIGAKDGVIFYMDLKPVKIYEFSSAKDLAKKAKEFEVIKEWPSNGKFSIHTNNEEALKIFNSVK